MKAAIYCRVSTDKQESEGTSLTTQMQSCLNYCKNKGYDVAHQFSETYSGLSLERPQIDKLRGLVRNQEIDVIVVYCLDRLSRDPTHGVILTQELEKYHIPLEAVTEDVDNSELGKLITYIRGFSAKLEAEKIRERSIRGKRARALSGKLPSGTGHKLYGYTYLPGKGTGEGVRYINEEEAAWVRKMYQWLIEERLTVNAITRRLRELSIPTPGESKFWLRQTVHRILTNLAYTGRTYAFTREYVEPKKRRANGKRKKTGIVVRPTDQWIEIRDVTPRIIDDNTFETAQAILKRNKELSTRNAKREYLLGGYIFCSRCGRRYIGYVKKWRDNGKVYEQRYYRCGDSQSIVNPDRCDNKQCNAPVIERAVWGEIEKAITRPETVFACMQAKKSTPNPEYMEKELDTIERQILNRGKQKDRIHKAFYMTGDEAKFREDIGNLESEIKHLKQRQTELQQAIESSRELQRSMADIKEACELIKSNLISIDYNKRRFVLEALRIKIMVDGDDVILGGLLPSKIVSSATRLRKRRWRISLL